MTEAEYIDCSNLAKVRACKTILLDTCPADEKEHAWEVKAFDLLRQWEARLEKRVTCDVPAVSETDG